MTDQKKVVVGADFAGMPLKDAVKAHLIERGWEVTDVTPTLDESDMYHRIGFKVGSQVSEGNFHKGIAVCGSGMGIHVAASKCPHVHAAVCETLASAKRAATANNCNVMAMGAFFVGPELGMAMADAFLENELGDGYEDWEGFYEYHKLGYDECENFDYEAYRANGFELVDAPTIALGPEPKGLAF